MRAAFQPANGSPCDHEVDHIVGIPSARMRLRSHDHRPSTVIECEQTSDEYRNQLIGKEWITRRLLMDHSASAMARSVRSKSIPISRPGLQEREAQG